MEKLIEEVASQPLGKKWVQLYIRLGLKPPDRFKIMAEHKHLQSEAEQVRCYILDTVAVWRKSDSMVRRSGRETMKLLLDALGKVHGFEAVALELSDKHGIHREAKSTAKSVTKPQSDDSSSASKDGVTQKRHPPLVSTPVIDKKVDRQHEAILKVKTSTSSSSPVTNRKGRDEYDTSSQHDQPSLLKVDAYSQQRHYDLESATPPMTTGPSEHVEVEAGSSFSFNSESLSERSGSIFVQEIFQVPIDMENEVHKFAILDVVQRISVRHWTYFLSHFELSRETVQKLSKERAIEEKYYNAIKEWLKIKKEQATFAVLNNLLGQCNQRGAQMVMKQRLKCNRHLLEGASLCK